MKYIFSDQYKFVYFVNQKVACSSIKEAFLPVFDIDPAPYTRINRRGQERIRKHQAFDDSEYQVNKETFLQLIDKNRFEDHFKFGFVRNPWDRLLSCYIQKIGKRKQGEKNGSPLRQPKEMPNAFRMDMTFKRFVETVHEIPDSESDPHFRSQHLIFYRKGLDGLLADYVAPFENLSAEFEKVMVNVGLGGKIKLPHLLRSRKRGKDSYTDYYNNKTRKLVKERFAQDIEAFKYRFGS